ncbi:hypothetical protein HQ447_13145 [bacterium]|nr:hypothetical protein [bacterium]
MTIVFPAPKETRIYSTDTAPLRRVRLQPGDRSRFAQANEQLSSVSAKS